MSAHPAWVPSDPRAPFCFRSPDGTAWIYLPGPPQAELDGRGAASLHLWPLGERAILQLGARWGLSADEERALRQAISTAERGPASNTDSLRLQPAPVRVQGARLELLSTPAGEPAPARDAGAAAAAGAKAAQATSASPVLLLTESSSSQAPPYSALFNLPLAGEQLLAAQATLRGERGHLRLSYRLELLAPIPVRVELVPGGRGGGSWPTSRVELEQVLSRGSLSLRWSLPSGLSPALRLELGQVGLERLAVALRQPGRPGASAGGILQAEMSLPTGTPLEPVADLADWVAGAHSD
jgi:hypothetical protein